MIRGEQKSIQLSEYLNVLCLGLPYSGAVCGETRKHGFEGEVVGDTLPSTL